MTDRSTARNNVPQGLFEELHTLTAASFSAEITAEQRKRLEALLEDPVALDLYLDVIDETSTMLTWADYPGASTADLAMAAHGFHRNGLHAKGPAVRPRASGFRLRVQLWLAVALSLAGALAIVVVWKADGRWNSRPNRQKVLIRGDEREVRGQESKPASPHVARPTSNAPRPRPRAPSPGSSALTTAFGQTPISRLRMAIAWMPANASNFARAWWRLSSTVVPG